MHTHTFSHTHLGNGDSEQNRGDRGVKKGSQKNVVQGLHVYLEPFAALEAVAAYWQLYDPRKHREDDHERVLQQRVCMYVCVWWVCVCVRNSLPFMRSIFVCLWQNSEKRWFFAMNRAWLIGMLLWNSNPSCPLHAHRMVCLRKLQKKMFCFSWTPIPPKTNIKKACQQSRAGVVLTVIIAYCRPVIKVMIGTTISRTTLPTASHL